MENKVIRFKNGISVIVILEEDIYNQKYVYCTKLNNKDLPTKDFITYKVDGDEFIEVTDELELKETSEVFYNKLTAKINEN